MRPEHPCPNCGGYSVRIHQEEVWERTGDYAYEYDRVQLCLKCCTLFGKNHEQSTILI
jgi:hypothetical protein